VTNLEVLAGLLHRIDQVEDHLHLLVTFGIEFTERLAGNSLLLADPPQLRIRLLIPLLSHLAQSVHSVFLFRQHDVDEVGLLLQLRLPTNKKFKFVIPTSHTRAEGKKGRALRSTSAGAAEPLGPALAAFRRSSAVWAGSSRSGTDGEPPSAN
jgi:hypothetical protein